MRKLSAVFVLMNVLSVLACKPADHHKKPLRYVQSQAQGKTLPETLSTDVLPNYKSLSAPYVERFTADPQVKPDESLMAAPGSATLPVADHISCLAGGAKSFHSIKQRQENIYSNLPKDLVASLNYTIDSNALAKKLIEDTIQVDVTATGQPAYSYSEQFLPQGSKEASVHKDLVGKAQAAAGEAYTCYDGLSSSTYAPPEGGYVTLADGTSSPATRITKSVVGKVICQTNAKTPGKIRTVVYDYARSIEIHIFAHDIAREEDPCIKGALVLFHQENFSFEGKSLRSEHYELLSVEANLK